MAIFWIWKHNDVIFNLKFFFWFAVVHFVEFEYTQLLIVISTILNNY